MYLPLIHLSARLCLIDEQVMKNAIRESGMFVAYGTVHFLYQSTSRKLNYDIKILM